jgi:hypothetical protein
MPKVHTSHITAVPATIVSHRYAAVQAKEVIEMMLIATADEILWKGLEMGGFNLRQQQSVKRMTCLKPFRVLYCSNPIVYAQIIEDLQTTHYHFTSHLDMIGWCS